MVSYEYQELFYKSHQVKDILVVDANATVTPVTGEAPTITDATIEIHTEDIESESFQLDECLCAEDNLRFGLCESAKVEFRIKNKADIPNLKSSEYGDLLNIYLYFNGDSDTLFQIGQYTCFKDDYTNNRKMREIELYDLNYTLNDLDITSWYNRYFSDGNRHQIIWAIADLFNWINKSGSYANDDSSPNIHIEIDPVYTLCNGAFPIGKTIESDTITFGFFMQGLLEFNGAFGHITREGKFKFLVMESYDKEPCRTVTDDFRKPPTNYSDDNTWGIGQLDVYDRTNVKKFSKQNTDKKKPSIYVMVDPWVIADRESGDSATETALQKLLLTINHYNYNKSETECSGDLCIEVGDRYNVEFTQASQYDTRNWFRSYVLERHFSGIQSMHDTYTAKGDKKQPLYQIPNENWHVGDSTTATRGQGTGGVSELNDEHDRRLIEIMRNYGQPMLDEPTVTLTYNKGDSQVEIKWTDPSDITSYSPLPVEWAGTIVVRKEGSQPIHRWGTEHSAFGGTVLVDSTTRDEYSVTAYVDDTIEPNKRYYYAIMPYFVALDDAQHPIKHYRWTKVYSVDTTRILVAPTIYPIQDSQISGTTVTVAYTIPTLTEGSYTVQKLVVKKGSIPTSKTDGDKIIDLTPDPSLLINGVTVTELDELSTYYFVIFIEDDQGNTASSEPMDCETGELTNIELFTDHFNEGVLVDEWSLASYQSQFADGNNRWAPLSLSQYYLTKWNLLAGNSSRRPLIEENGTLKARYATTTTDAVFWIPVRRTRANGRATINFEAMNSNVGVFYYTFVQIACIDSNGNWKYIGVSDHTPQQANTWYQYSDEITGDFEYIDYIGIGYCDGEPRFRNIEIIL